MFAARYIPGNHDLTIEDIPQPTPGADDVVLKVRAAGICHSDVHVLHGEVPYKHKFTMGHEICGSVVAKGANVKGDYKPDTLYAVHGPNPCGKCNYCKTGYDNLCNGTDRTYIGLGEDGGYADYVKVNARNIVEVPEGIPPQVAAVATDAVLTPYHAIKTLGEVKAGTRVLIIGLGGLGMNGLQVSLALGADVTACDLKDSSLETARGFGAKKIFNSKDVDKELAAMSFDVVIDFVGIEPTFLQAQKFVRPGGTIVLVGVGGAQVPVLGAQLATFQVRVQGAFWGTHAEMKEIYALIAAKKIQPVVETAPLKDVNHWLKELAAGRVKSRMALLP